MLSDKSAKSLFKVVGGLHLFFALLLVCVVVVSIIGLLSSEVANTQLNEAGKQSEFQMPLPLVILAIIISSVSIVLYCISSFGFLKQKNWQPTIYSIIVPFTIIELILNILTHGLNFVQLISVLFIFVWMWLLIVVWTKKHLFKN